MTLDGAATDFVDVLRKNWDSVTYEFDEAYYRQVYAEVTEIFAKYDLLGYVQPKADDPIAASLSFVFLCHELGPHCAHDRVVVDAVLSTVMAILEDADGGASIDPRDLAGPFRTPFWPLLKDFFGRLDRHWYDLVAEAHSRVYLSFYYEHLLRATEVPPPFSGYRMTPAAIRYMNALKAYVFDQRDWYGPAGPVGVQNFEAATTWLIECVRLSSLGPDQVDIVMRMHEQLAGNRFAEFLHRQVKLLYAWHLLRQGHGRRFLADLGVDVPAGLLSARLV